MSGPLIVVVGDVINDIIVRRLAPVAPGTDTPSEIEASTPRSPRAALW